MKLLKQIVEARAPNKKSKWSSSLAVSVVTREEKNSFENTFLDLCCIVIDERLIDRNIQHRQVHYLSYFFCLSFFCQWEIIT